MKAAPKKTRQDTEYYFRVWNSWRENWKKQGFNFPQLTESN